MTGLTTTFDAMLTAVQPRVYEGVRGDLARRTTLMTELTDALVTLDFGSPRSPRRKNLHTFFVNGRREA